MSYSNLQVLSTTFLLICNCVRSRFDAKFRHKVFEEFSILLYFMIAQCCHNFHFKISRSPVCHLAATVYRYQMCKSLFYLTFLIILINQIIFTCNILLYMYFILEAQGHFIAHLITHSKQFRQKRRQPECQDSNKGMCRWQLYISMLLWTFGLKEDFFKGEDLPLPIFALPWIHSWNIWPKPLPEWQHSK